MVSVCQQLPQSRLNQAQGRALRLAFFATNNGSGMKAIAEGVDAGILKSQLVGLVTNKQESGAGIWARDNNVPVLTLTGNPSTDENDGICANWLMQQRPDLIILSGYLKKIGPMTRSVFAGRILNMHPALLPKYGGQGMYGMRVHNAVLQAGDARSGATLHYIDGEYDTGPILMQVSVPVERGDVPEDLAARVMAVEAQLLTHFVACLEAGEVTIAGMD
jgi:phosphoribosylglycinamide formyltransferase-1